MFFFFINFESVISYCGRRTANDDGVLYTCQKPDDNFTLSLSMQMFTPCVVSGTTWFTHTE